MRRVAVSQRFLPHYRVAFFDQLSSTLHDRGGELRLFFSFDLGRLDGTWSWAHRIAALRADLRLAELEDSAIWAPGLFWRLIRYAPDVVVLEDLGGLPNSLVGALYCRLWNKPYLIWGLGEVPQKRRSKLRRYLGPAIKFLYGGAFGFVCYSAYAAEVYSRYAKPTYVAPNAYLPKPSDRNITEVERLITERYDRDKPAVISIGTLKRQKRYDVLIAAMSLLPTTISLHLVGDGPEADTLKDLVAKLGLVERVIFHGALYDESDKAALIASAHIGVVPGRGGLAIQEMMAYGVPVISGVADGTEQDLIRDRSNGYLLDGFPTAEQIAHALRTFFALPPTHRAVMARAAFEVVVTQSNTAVMVDAFAQALQAAAQS